MMGKETPMMITPTQLVRDSIIETNTYGNAPMVAQAAREFFTPLAARPDTVSAVAKVARIPRKLPGHIIDEYA
jgi:hypothetical protein